MRDSTPISKLLTDDETPQPKVAMFFVYFLLGLSLFVFGASIWFSSYQKRVYIRIRPDFHTQQSKIQHEIHKLILDENKLTDVERIRSISNELGLVEYTGSIVELRGSKSTKSQ
ncbi:cell division protein FtsL [Candidatus Poribacteria bacterium]|nr:cell division protein FtsL [Candidatus Poribacteria bacterium]